jgi:Fe-S-cluster containining protein
MAEATLTTIPTHKRKRRPHREQLKPGEVLCSFCPAKCCCYLALAIDTPKTWESFDYVRWYLLHERAAVFTEEGTWYLLVYNRCKHLRDDNLCDIYDTRPQICRDYTTKNCEYEDDWVYDQYWETAEQVEEYAEAVLGPRPGNGFRSPRLG